MNKPQHQFKLKLNKLEKEIAVKNRELEIETALEKVRTKAMAMREPADMLDVCKTISLQLQSLGVKEIRNVQTAIFYKHRGTYMNYEYYAKHNKTFITETAYTNNIIHKAFASKMLKGKGEFFITHIKGKKVKEWIAYQKTTNVFIDKFLETASSLNYYWFSLGPVALGISTYHPLLEEETNLFKRFLKVFELAYRRYMDIEKAEAQAREAQIEAALERVRASSMAMHNSNDVGNATAIMFSELDKLGIETIRCGIDIMDKSKIFEVWASTTSEKGRVIQIIGKLDSRIHPHLQRVQEAWERQDKFISSVLEGQDLEDYYKKLSTAPDYRVPATRVQSNKQFNYDFFFKEGGLFAYRLKPFTEEEIMILQRFTSVFGLTFRRYLDLKKAEAQTKESQIQLALERIRARTMAMQKSSELLDVITVVSQQLKNLDFRFDHVSFAVNNQMHDYSFWLSFSDQPHPYRIFVPYLNNPVPERAKQALQNGFSFYTDIVNAEESKQWHEHVFKHNKLDFVTDKLKRIIFRKGFARSIALMPNIMLIVANYAARSYSEEENNIIKRFATVFEQSYTRFLDLQKAEAQAREAQIEAALERVRAKAMAMHSSNDLSDTMGVLFKELPKLGISSLRCGVVLLSRNSTRGVFYAAATTQESDSFTMIGSGDMMKHPVFMKQYESWLKNQYYFVTLSGEDLQSYYKEIFARLSETYTPREHKLKTEHGYYFSFSEGMLYAWSDQPYSEESISILNRFKAIIDLTFRRYLDLKKAEVQAREAQIEAALERVRGRAMAMHSSEDFVATIVAFYHELEQLSFTPRRCGVGIIDKETRIVELSTLNTTDKGESIELVGKIKLEGHPILENVYNNWLIQNEYHPVLRGDEIKEYYKFIGPQIAIPDYSGDQVQYGYFFYFNEGGVYSWTEKKFSDDELQIYRRFTTVLSLTYRRYLDLKEAEVRAIESIRQAALDRIRAEIASMRTSEDLNRITPIIWRELKILGVPFFRCGVYIIDETQEKVQVYLTTPDGKSLGVLNLSFDSNEMTRNTVEHWREKHVYRVHWNKEDFINWTKSMIEIGQIQNVQTYQDSAEPPESLYLNFVPFAQGMLYVGDINPLTDEKLKLVKTLAEAFSIAYARYEDFRKLEEAKNKIELTLTELKSAQAQLVHSEKMASLGELTAGIAHEIKNPLNFVNNFSEVSNDLISEMVEEADKGNLNEVKDIANNIKQNLEKILQHGKRADSIVKGMLLHSRGTSGEKTLTDINDLLDQYVNLAYHGMRAQNKDFNISIKKDYDNTIEKINVVPQDISRVFLNIINNACYAAYNRKKKDGDSNFSPTLKVSTKKLNGRVEIRISDNGDGIPAEILDKIFQPFFTTKPTGEGTGLGLSLSYDIVTKVHGGELKVETKEGEGTEFIIILNN